MTLWRLRAACELKAIWQLVDWPNRSSKPVVPLSKIQVDVLRRLAAHRDPETYAPRYSSDIHVFHDRVERVAQAAFVDAGVLSAAGYAVAWLRQQPLAYTAAVSKDGASTRLEWVVDSDYRFFPTIPDDVFGYVLHPVDLAMNNVLAATDRREVRDLVDLVTIDETALPLGAVIWAAVEKAPGFTPEGLIAEIRRNEHYSPPEWRALLTSEPLDPAIVMARLRRALDDAESFVLKMPTEMAGLLFLKDGKPVQPDPAKLAEYQTHAGRRRGHWPGSLEIEAAMWDRYKTPPQS
jgi:hypothetical protein